MNKLLIVDDNPQNIYMLEILLKTNGFEVEICFKRLTSAGTGPPEFAGDDHF